MTIRHLWAIAAALAFHASVVCAAALQGDIRVHDPSTIVQCDGRYWVFATGAGIKVRSSADGYTWQEEPPVFTEIPASVKSAVPNNNGIDVWAPDITKYNGEYYLYYAVSSWGSSVSAIGLATSPTLTPTDAKYHWTDHGIVIRSLDGQKLNCIDPCIVNAPDGTLWLSYGSYIGVVEVVQLDPKTGLRIAPDSPRYPLSSASEASAIIYHDGFYYLFVNRGSCCQGRASTYNIRMGRCEKITGPYLDQYGVDMLHGGGSLFLASAGKQVGPGHFGLLTMNGLERFSCHYESDADQHYNSTLDIRPLLWIDGWPAAGSDITDGTYQIICKRTRNVIQVAGLSVAGTTVKAEPYITADSQKWKVVSLGAGNYQIVGVRSGMALDEKLQIAADSESENQTWQIQQVSDGWYRILAKSSGLALTAGSGRGHGLELAPYTGADMQKWSLAMP